MVYTVTVNFVNYVGCFVINLGKTGKKMLSTSLTFHWGIWIVFFFSKQGLDNNDSKNRSCVCRAFLSNAEKPYNEHGQSDLRWHNISMSKNEQNKRWISLFIRDNKDFVYEFDNVKRPFYTSCSTIADVLNQPMFYHFNKKRLKSIQNRKFLTKWKVFFLFSC